MKTAAVAIHTHNTTKLDRYLCMFGVFLGKGINIVMIVDIQNPGKNSTIDESNAPSIIEFSNAQLKSRLKNRKVM